MFLCLQERPRSVDGPDQHYTIIDFNEVDMKIYLPEKVISSKAAREF